MWFRNLTLYSFTGFPYSTEAFGERIAGSAFTACTAAQERSVGFVQPTGDGPHAFAVNGMFMLALCIEKKVLPASVVKEAFAARVAEYEKLCGHKPGKIDRRNLKEDTRDALLSQAFSTKKVVRAWIDPNRGLLAVDTASKADAELFIACLLRSLDKGLDLRPYNTVLDPVAAMTAWIAGEPPSGFTVDTDTTFTGNNGALVKFANTTLEAVDVSRQLHAGKRVTRLALTFEDGVSFTLSSGCVLRRVSPLKTLMKQKNEEALTFAADFLIMAAEYGRLIGALTESLDGLAPVEKPEETPAQDDTGDDDPAYEQARAIVIGEQKASISLVQRHLRIGYNRAASLLEEMEKRGVVSTMNNTSGMRTVLIAKGAA